VVLYHLVPEFRAIGEKTFTQSLCVFCDSTGVCLTWGSQEDCYRDDGNPDGDSVCPETCSPPMAVHLSLVSLRFIASNGWSDERGVCVEFTSVWTARHNDKIHPGKSISNMDLGNSRVRESVYSSYHHRSL
jgi:hypothetical protein